jgi:pimeloyl-ACP methyl ester carboxylesterase
VTPASPASALHVVEHGDPGGVPVLAIHGWTPDHRLMTGCLEPVFGRRAGYRRIYPDLPGMGRSPVGSVESTAEVVDVLEALIDERIGDVPFLLVGESYGGYLSRELVRRRPGQVLGLALICPIGPIVRREDRTRPSRMVLEADEALLAELDPAEREEFTDVAVVQDREQLDRFRADVAPGLALADADGMARIAQSWELDPLPEDGAQFDRPALWVLGRQDDHVGYRDQWDLLEHYPRASFAVLDRAGHNLQQEQPVLFEALVEEWLDRVGRQAQQGAR